MRNRTKDSVVHFDWAFLLFLICITNVKIYVKVFGVLFYCVYFFSKKYKAGTGQGFSSFYFIMPFIGVIGSLLHGSFFVPNYWFTFMLGVLNWLLGGIGTYFLYIAVQNIPKHKLLATIKMFFLLNTLVCFGELGKMIYQSGQLVPYWYWEPTEYYGGSTGDHIQGITANISVTNATINAIGILFFLFYKEVKWAAMCMLVLLLCTSNMTLILTIASLIGLFVIRRDKIFRKHVLIVLLIALCIYPILSLNNVKYVDKIYSDEVNYSKEIERNKVVRPLINNRNTDIGTSLAHIQTGDIDKSKYYRLPLNDKKLISHKDDLKYLRQFGTLNSVSNDNLLFEPDSLKGLLVKWYGMPYPKMPLSLYSGIKKFYTIKQTAYYLGQGYENLICGAGIGNFSSRLAIKATGLGLQGDYPLNYVYISSDYLHYHFFSLIYLFSMPISEHSILNMVNSVYNQVAGEYGLLGCLVFLLVYVGYVWRNRKKLNSGAYVFMMGLVFFLFEYWFEMVSLTILIEFIILFEIFGKEKDVAES